MSARECFDLAAEAGGYQFDPCRDMIHMIIPGLTPMNTAAGKHRFIRYKSKKWWYQQVLWNLRVLNRREKKPWERAAVVLIRHSSVEPDHDALAQGGKFLLDGIQPRSKAGWPGVIVDDKRSVIGRPIYEWFKVAPKSGFMELFAMELTPEERLIR